MAFRAVHTQWGTVFAHLPDLGCGQAWEAVWKARPAVPLTCPECGHPMHAKVSPEPRRPRFFAHAPHAPNCALALETIDHHLLKLELANAARAAGAHAEMEVRGPDGAWIADVLASGSDGRWRMALEAQLAHKTDTEIVGRYERMRADGVESIWFSDRPQSPWLGVVPSARLTRPDDGQYMIIADGLVRFRPCRECRIGDRDYCGRHWEDVPATLVQFFGWAFTGRIRAHRCSHERALIWTAPRYIAEHEALAERERRIEAALLRGQGRQVAGISVSDAVAIMTGTRPTLSPWTRPCLAIDPRRVRRSPRPGLGPSPMPPRPNRPPAA